MEEIGLGKLLDLYELKRFRTVYKTLRKKDEKLDMAYCDYDEKKIVLNWRYFKDSKKEVYHTIVHEFVHIYFYFEKGIKEYIGKKKDIQECFHICDREFIVDDFAKKVLCEADIKSMKRLTAMLEKVKNTDKRKVKKK